jgi:hypothetical protein
LDNISIITDEDGINWYLLYNYEKYLEIKRIKGI